MACYFPKGTQVSIRAHKSETGMGLTYPAIAKAWTLEGSRLGVTAGADVIEVETIGQDSPISVYAFDTEPAPGPIRESIKRGMARAAWVSWWANQCACGRYDFESCRLEPSGRARADKAPHRHYELGGLANVLALTDGKSRDIDDAAPPTPDDALDLAERFIQDCEKAGGRDIVTLYLEAADDVMPNGDEAIHCQDPTPHLFGHYISMESQGHGVSWADDHPDVSWDIPHTMEGYAGQDLYPAPMAGQAWGSSKRNPKRVTPLDISRETAGMYRWVGYWVPPSGDPLAHSHGPIAAWRRVHPRPSSVMPLIDARIPAPLYIFQRARVK